MNDDHRAVNRAVWDERADAHAASPGYGVGRFAAEPGHISDVVRFDLPRLGDVAGLRGVHLQCHIGTDTVSLARLGARMTGLDFSAPALAQARALAAAAGVEVDFVESDLYAAPEALGLASFDLVYTGVGALCWLPSVTRWAHVVSALLAPGGRLFLREGHPMLWSLADPRPDELVVVGTPTSSARRPPCSSRRAPTSRPTSQFEHSTTHEWNHGLGEIVTALLEQGLQLTGLVEHDSVPWDALPGQMEALPDGEWRLRDRPWRLAHSYTLQAVKPT